MTLTLTWNAPVAPTPVVSSVNAAVLSATSAQVSWNVSPSATGQIFWGTATGTVIGDYPNSSLLESGNIPFHSQTLTGLPSGTVYYRIQSTTAAGGSSLSGEYTLVASSSGSDFDTGMTYTTTVDWPTGAGWTDGSDARTNIQSLLATYGSGTSTTSHVRHRPAAGYTYTVSRSIDVTGLSHVSFEGGGTETSYGHTGGAVIKTTGNPSNTSYSGISSAWVMRSASSSVSATDIRWHCITSEGSSTTYATTTAGDGGEYQHGWCLMGGNDIELSHCIADKVRGDGVYITDSRNGGALTDNYWSRDVYIHHSTIRNVGRMGIAIHHARGVDIFDSEFRDAAYAHFDFEPDWASTYANSSDVRIRRCVFTGGHQWDPDSNAGVILHTRIVGVSGTFTRSGLWEITDCVFDSPNKSQPNYGMIHLYLGPIIGGTLLIENNTCTVPRSGEPIIFRNFTGGVTVRNNTGFGVGQDPVRDYGGNGTTVISGNT